MAIASMAERTAADTADILDQLNALRGQQVRFQGMDCRVFDVIDQPPLVVLQRLQAQVGINADSYGHPVGIGQDYIDVPVFDEQGSLSAEFRMILLPGDPGDESEK